MINRHILPLLIFVIMLAFLWHGMSLDQQQLPAAMLNKPMPKFVLPDLTNSSVVVTEQLFKDKISLIHVWASWCSACKQDQALLSTLVKTSDFQLVGINYKDLRNDADLCLNKHNDLYRVTLFDFDGSLGMDLGVYGTPTTFIVDRKGIIRFRHVGSLTYEIWSSQIVPAINKLS